MINLKYTNLMKYDQIKCIFQIIDTDCQFFVKMSNSNAGTARNITDGGHWVPMSHRSDGRRASILVASWLVAHLAASSAAELASHRDRRQ